MDAVLAAGSIVIAWEIVPIVVEAVVCAATRIKLIVRTAVRGVPVARIAEKVVVIVARVLLSIVKVSIATKVLPIIVQCSFEANQILCEFIQVEVFIEIAIWILIVLFKSIILKGIAIATAAAIVWVERPIAKVAVIRAWVERIPVVVVRAICDKLKWVRKKF